MRLMPDSAAPGAVTRRRVSWRGWRLGYPRRLGHRRRTWLAAAAAAVAVGVTLVAVRSAGQSATPPAAAASGVPEYYVALSPVPELGFFSSAAVAVVGDTFTGRRVATVAAPKGWGFGSVTAAGDDRTFVLVVEPRSSSQQPVVTRWYLLRLTPGAAHPATLRQLPIPPQSLFATAFTAVVSPDGSMLAIASETEPPVTGLRVYSTVTGALLNTWSESPSELRAIQTLGPVSWTSGGRQLTFQTIAAGTGTAVVRLLPAGDPGHDLLADSRAVFSFPAGLTSPHNCVDGFLVAGNGKTVVCGSAVQAGEPAGDTGSRACPAYARPFTTSVRQFSAVTGKLTGMLYQAGVACQMEGDLGLFWSNDAGTAVLGYFGHSSAGQSGSPQLTVGRFGLFTGGEFTPLPAPLESDQGYPSTTAW